MRRTVPFPRACLIYEHQMELRGKILTETTSDSICNRMKGEDEDELSDDGAMKEIQLYLSLSFPEIGKCNHCIMLKLQQHFIRIQKL